MKTRQINFKVTEEEWEKLHLLAAKRGVTMSELMCTWISKEAA